MSRLSDRYKTEIVKQMMKTFNYKSVMQVPSLKKVVLNMGLGEALQNAKIIDIAVKDLSAIAGQHPMVTKSKKAVAAFKLRQGVPIGCMVTLRKERMYEFIDRFFNVVIPRIRDFKGMNPKAFDGSGNYTLGLKEQLIFPEVKPESSEKPTGMNVTFVTSAKTNEESFYLLKQLGMPFRDQK